MSAIQLLEEIELARVEPGAQRVDHDTYNETYLGVVRSHSGLHNAYIKPLSGRQLINELVVSVLARSLSLPVPQGFLVIFSQADLPGSQVLGQVPRAGDGEFLGFACSEVKSLSLARRAKSDKALALLIAKNIELLKDTLIFDEWVANVDRHYNNILVTSNNALSLIDHGHCFTGPDWKTSDLRHADSYNNRRIYSW